MSGELEPDNLSASVEANNRSVLARVAYLNAIIQSPAAYSPDKQLLAALKSQAGLARLMVGEVNIFPMALNTLKSRANDIVAGGFGAVDRLRLLAIQTIEASIKVRPASSPMTKQHLKQQLKDQEKVIAQLWDEIALVTGLFRESMALAQQFAEKCPDPSDRDLFKKRRRELLSMCSLAQKLPDT
jgi:hypothetical protein